MIKRRYFSALAIGLLTSFAFATPAQASGTVVTQMVTFGTNANTVKLTEIDFTYTGAQTITDVSDFSGFAFAKSGSNYVPVSFTTTFVGPKTIELKFAGTGATLASGSFTFDSSKPYSVAPGITVAVTTKPSGHQNLVTGRMLSFAPVPEPSSMALLGIGMTSFLAFRRFFKRTPLA
jgi:hypothetical protein